MAQCLVCLMVFGLEGAAQNAAATALGRAGSSLAVALATRIACPSPAACPAGAPCQLSCPAAPNCQLVCPAVECGNSLTLLLVVAAISCATGALGAIVWSAHAPAGKELYSVALEQRRLETDTARVGESRTGCKHVAADPSSAVELVAPVDLQAAAQAQVAFIRSR